MFLWFFVGICCFLQYFDKMCGFFHNFLSMFCSFLAKFMFFFCVRLTDMVYFSWSFDEIHAFTWLFWWNSHIFCDLSMKFVFVCDLFAKFTFFCDLTKFAFFSDHLAKFAFFFFSQSSSKICLFFFFQFIDCAFNNASILTKFAVFQDLFKKFVYFFSFSFFMTTICLFSSKFTSFSWSFNKYDMFFAVFW